MDLSDTKGLAAGLDKKEVSNRPSLGQEQGSTFTENFQQLITSMLIFQSHSYTVYNLQMALSSEQFPRNLIVKPNISTLFHWTQSIYVQGVKLLLN